MTRMLAAVVVVVVTAVVPIALLGFAQPSPDKRSGATRPAGPAAAPPRKVLVITMTRGFRHDSIDTAKDVLKRLGETSGAFAPTITDDLSHLDRARLAGFDAVMFCNTSGELPLSDPQKQHMLDFVANGGGLVGVHAATDTFYSWPAYGEMIGGYFDGHPWGASDTVTIKVEQPDHPIARPFGRAPFELKEEIYQFRAPYERSKMNVLMSLDTTRTDMRKEGINRTDGDFPVAWTKPHGDGRVFYTSLGHNEAVWEDRRFQAHLLAGIEWAAGGGEDDG